MDTETRIAALAAHLGCEPDDITEFEDGHFTVGRNEYLVLTDGEADEKAQEYILDSLWALNTDFLAHHLAIRNVNAAVRKALAKLQEELREDANELLRAMVDNEDRLVREAIGADGRVHFLDTYDGNETELSAPDGTTLYVYRLN